MEEALEEVMIESERHRNHSMMGMFGLDPNKLDFDYEKHFPEQDGVAQVRMAQVQKDRMAQVRKDQLSKRHSVAVLTNTIRKSEEDLAGGDTSSNRRQRKKPVAKNTVSLPPAAKSKQRSISLIHSNIKVSTDGSLTSLREDAED